MAKFSLDGDEEEEEEEEGEGPSTSSPKHKRQRRVSVDASRSEENLDDDVDDQDSELKSKEEGNGVSMTLMDPDVLDCSICMESLSPPVFQCENGHIACSTCCTKLFNKCPSCSWPIGYNRCLAIEKVIESIKVSCRYKPYGCRGTFSYMCKNAHEETCIYSPCVCPISDCDFRGSSKQLSLHFSSKHWSSARRFRYNCPFSVSFTKLDSYLVLQGEDDDLLFVLNNQVERIGNTITVVCLDPRCSNGGFSYDIISRKGGSTLRLESHTKFVRERNEASSSGEFLLVPYDFCCPSGKLKVEICIWSSRLPQ